MLAGITAYVYVSSLASQTPTHPPCCIDMFPLLVNSSATVAFTHAAVMVMPGMAVKYIFGLFLNGGHWCITDCG